MLRTPPHRLSARAATLVLTFGFLVAPHAAPGPASATSIRTTYPGDATTDRADARVVRLIARRGDEWVGTVCGQSPQHYDTIICHAYYNGRNGRRGGCEQTYLIRRRRVIADAPERCGCPWLPVVIEVRGDDIAIPASLFGVPPRGRVCMRSAR